MVSLVARINLILCKNLPGKIKTKSGAIFYDVALRGVNSAM